jgi:hypothetical protein
MLDLRAAELTLQSGYQKFSVVNRTVDGEARTLEMHGGRIWVESGKDSTFQMKLPMRATARRWRASSVGA